MNSLLHVFLDINRNGDAVLSVEGELDIASGSQLQQWVHSLPKNPHKRYLIDLTRLRFCDATGVRALLAIYRELSGQTSEVAFISPRKNSVQKILTIAGVVDHVPFHTSTDAAVQGTQESSRPLRSLPDVGPPGSNGKHPAP